MSLFSKLIFFIFKYFTHIQFIKYNEATKCWKLQGKGMLTATEEAFGIMDLTGKIVAVYTWGLGYAKKLPLLEVL